MSDAEHDRDHAVRRHHYDERPDVVAIEAGAETVALEVDRAQTLQEALETVLDDADPRG